MNHKDFLQTLINYGIDPDHFRIRIGNYTRSYNTFCIFQADGGHWLICKTDDKCNCQFYDGTMDEEEAFYVFLKVIIDCLRDSGYIYDDLSSADILTSKATVSDFLKSHYNMSDRECDQTWNYLAQNFRVLNEFKYFVCHDDFVSSKDCYKINDWTAEKAHNKMHLLAVDCFKYLVYLESDK